jgi:hypothetical protein
MHIGFWWKSQKVRDHYEGIHVGGRLIQKLMLEKYDGEIWTGFIWLRIGTLGWLLSTR